MTQDQALRGLNGGSRTRPIFSKRMISMPQCVHHLILLSCIGGVLAATGCAGTSRRPADAVTRAWDSPTAPPGSENVKSNSTGDTGRASDSNTETSRSPGAPAIARVNDVPISRQRVADILINAFGVDTLELLIRLELARKRADLDGITVSSADVRVEYDRALREIASPIVPENETQLDHDNAERVLETMLARNHLSKAQFMIRIEQNAYLRKLAERSVVVDDRLLAAEYERAYGERVRIRHMQLNSLSEVTEVRTRLAEGADFELLIAKYSRNNVTATAGGLLPAFSRDDDVPPLLRDAAFALGEGRISNPIHEEGSYHLIRLEQRIAASSVPIDEVRDELRVRLRRRLIDARMRQIAADLFDDARIEIRDATLLQQFRANYPNAAIQKTAK